jgi:hypothetical protein
VHRYPIRHHANEAECAEILDDRVMGEPSDGRKWKADLHPPPTTGQDLVCGSLGGVPPDRATTLAAVAPADPGPEQTQVVVDLGGGAHGRATGDHGIPLLDGHRGGQALQAVHLRLGHPVEELLGVSRQRLDVAPLPLGVERVEGERALA